MAEPQASRTGPPADKFSAQRDHEDDFFCLRFRVWYPSIDCAYRTKFKTCPGCLECEQGRFNLKRHNDSLGKSSFSLLPVRD